MLFHCIILCYLLLLKLRGNSSREIKKGEIEERLGVGGQIEFVWGQRSLCIVYTIFVENKKKKIVSCLSLELFASPQLIATISKNFSYLSIFSLHYSHFSFAFFIFYIFLSI